MTTIATALNTEFTPAAGDFDVQVSGGAANLMRKQTSGAPFENAGRLQNECAIVSNRAGNVYKFVAIIGTPTVQADQ